ncbi:uncharacterized protein G2W53_044615 [Senna tora]|uniref:Uncharacterized protein n=1 Tax=Senna tora TaxID=362788 RepID=A0A834SCY7_9FABA|nr:uncharacterized protein G2W53_044615 [Senna tora]
MTIRLLQHRNTVSRSPNKSPAVPVTFLLDLSHIQLGVLTVKIISLLLGCCICSSCPLRTSMTAIRNLPPCGGIKDVDAYVGGLEIRGGSPEFGSRISGPCLVVDSPFFTS